MVVPTDQESGGSPSSGAWTMDRTSCEVAGVSPRLSSRPRLLSRAITSPGGAASYAGGATHYDTFGLTPSSTHEEVRQAYIASALRYHPDRQDGEGVAARAQAERRMQEANGAWAVLGDREARAAYDADLGLGPEPEVQVERGWDPMAAAAPVGVRTTLRRFAPVLIVLALLAAIFLFTAYAGPAPS